MEQTPARKYKSFEYNVATTWTSGKQGTIESEGRPTVEVAPPPEFKGVAGFWTPEDLFVASIDVCQMTTFLALAARAGIMLNAYRTSARGKLDFVDGGYRFTSVTIRPVITVAAGTDPDLVRRVVEDAHHGCLVGRSVNAPIEVIPEIIVE